MIPQQNNETPVGLAGLQKSGVAVPSQTRNMEYFFNLAKKMSDGQLADVLSGKALNVPQFVAMTEAMGRKQLRQAMQGAQAQQQAQQPSVKDQLLAEEAGLAALPAPNMASLGEGHAAGGIIAFEDGGEVPRFYGGGNPWDRLRQNDQDPDVFLSNAWFKKNFEGEGGIAGSKAAKRKADIEAQQRLNAREKEGFNEPIMRSDEDPYGAASPVVPNSAPGVTEPPVNAEVKPPKPSSGLPAIDVSQATKFERRASPFAGMSAEQVDYEGLKDRGLGEGLLRLAGGILSKPGAAGYGAGMAALAEQAGLTRKEIAGLKKDARDYEFNIKKAESAFEQGNDELALKYTEAANLNKYRMASLAQEPGELRTLRAIAANPELASFYKGANKADMYSLKDASNDFLQLQKDNPREARRLQGLGINTAADFRQYQLTGLPPLQVVGTLDKGAPIRN